MAKIDDYWKQLSASERFQDLSDEDKERARTKLFDQFVGSTPQYKNLTDTQRNQVLDTYNERTKLEPESIMGGIAREGKKIGKAIQPAIQKGKELIQGVPRAVERGVLGAQAGLEKVGGAVTKAVGEMDPYDVSNIEALGEVTPIPGAEALKEKISGVAESVASAIEPGYVKPSLTAFDVARAIGSGSVKLAGEAISGVVPETTSGASLFFAEPVFKFAGTTFLGHDIHVPRWKPKTGLSIERSAMGDQMEKLITQERIQNYARGGKPAPAGLIQMPAIKLGGEGSTGVTEGPPRPLEVLANEEAKVQAKIEVDQYDEWLKQADKTSPSGGTPPDIHPDVKTNVSQLRDLARNRLQKLQDEPVRVESLSKAEDALQGYYRRRIDQARVYMQPAGEALEPQKMIEAPEQPAGLLKSGEVPKPVRGRPAPAAPEVTLPQEPVPAAPAKAPAPSTLGSLKAKDVVFKTFKALFRGETDAANDISAGAFVKSMGWKPNRELSQAEMDMVGKLVPAEHAEHIAKEKPPTPIQKTTEAKILEEKGIDWSKAEALAKIRKGEHELDRQVRLEKRNRFDQVVGKIKRYKADPETGIEHLKEEYDTHVPKQFRTSDPNAPTMDQAAEMLYGEGDILSPDVNALTKHLDDLEAVGHPISWQNFMDAAVNELEHDRRAAAGLEPETLDMGGEKAVEAGPVVGAGEQTRIPGTEATFETAKPPAIKPIAEIPPVKSIKDMSTFDMTGQLFKDLGEKGEVGLGGDIDPIKQARQEAILKELVQRAMALGYDTTQDIMLYAARNAPKEMQDAIRKNLAPTLSAFDDHAYKELDEAKKGNAVAKKSIQDAAERGYFARKADAFKNNYKRFKANQQIAMFKDGDEGKMRLENDLFIHDNYRKFSKDERAAQRWYIEGKSPKLESLTALGVPEETAKKWLNLAKNPTELMKSARQATQMFEDEYHDLLSEFYDEMGYVADHVTRRWKRPEQYLDWEGRTLSNRPNFAKGRKLLSQADGIDAGFEPVSWDIRDDLRASNNARVNILGRIHAYQKLGASMAPDGPAMINEAENALTQARAAKLTPHSGEAPKSWLRFPTTPLLRDVAINPYYKEVVQYMMARPFQGTTVEFLNFAGASTKAAKLIGLFHGYTQGEMVLSGINYRDVFSFNKNRNTVFRALRYTAKAITADMEGEPFSKNPMKAIGQLYDSYMSGHGALANRPLALKMAERNFKIGGVDDDVHSILSSNLLRLEGYLSKKIGETPAKGITVLPRHAIDILNKSIFDYMRTIGSMLVYEDNVADGIKKYNLDMPEGKKMPVEEIEKQISAQTSNAMGGLTYAQFMAHPRTQQMFQWLMLAPQWTIGRVQMAGATLLKGPQGNMARKQMARLFIGWYFASNAINYAKTKKYLGKGRFMNENPEGYRDQAFRKKDKDGTHYYQLSKALTEISDDFEHPFKTATHKASPPVQSFVKLMNWGAGRDYYTNPYEKPENPLKTLGEAYVPMFVSGQSAYGGLPMHKGPSKNYVMGMLDHYYSGGMKDQRLYNRALLIGEEQGYDVSKLDREVKSSRKRQERAALLR